MQLINSLARLGSLPQPIGLVPTMGALHRGHFSLLARARRECATVVASIYVNPLQFGPNEDFNRYPRTLREDAALCQEAGVDVVFAPQQLTERVQTLVIPPPSLTEGLCGAQRPGHFTGVATVVLQLLHLIHPQRCYFGQKDAQQLAVLQRVVQDLCLPVGIIPCPTLREFDGLALSSRNRYLNPDERQQAPQLYQALQAAQTAFLQGESDPEVLSQLVFDHLPNFNVEYVSLVQPSTLQPVVEAQDPTLLALAVRLGSTRLIDNLRLTSQKAPIVAIDGPAGSGKSTVAKQVAYQLQFTHLDTGAMYRAVTWAALTRSIPLTPPALTRLAHQLDLKLVTTPDRTLVWVDGQEITEEIRTSLVSTQVSMVSAVEGVRQVLVQKQQALGRSGGVVMEGRDIGTQVFPQAELKIFLTASPAERARRRHQELAQKQPEAPNFGEILAQIEARDEQDRGRSVSPLVQALDALVIHTDDLTAEQVTERICGWARYL